MLTQKLGYPRIGGQRQLKKASEQFWAGKIYLAELHSVARQIKKENRKTQLDAGVELIPCNNFSSYDQTLDTSQLLGMVPQRYEAYACTPKWLKTKAALTNMGRLGRPASKLTYKVLSK